jgi:hypothetical protein
MKNISEKQLPKMKFTIGSDPELMLLNRKSGKIVSSLPVLKTDKHAPIDLQNGIFMYADNILAEAKLPPVEGKAAFVGVFRDTFTRMKQYLGEEHVLVPIASHIYDESELQDPKAWEIGCTANYNGYTESVNEIVNFENGLRTGSAHIHLGNVKLTDFDVRHQAIRLLDMFLGCSSVIFDTDVKASKARRKYYGAAGEFRPTPYGLEYRVLSPFVLRSPVLVELVYDIIDYTMSIVEGEEIAETLALVSSADVQKAINNCDTKLARKVLIAAGLPKELLKRVEAKYNTKDFHKNWDI